MVSRRLRPFTISGVQSVPFRNDEAAPSVICRPNRSKGRIEWQADFFASALLMPRELVYAAWERRFRTREPFIYRERHWRDWTDRLSRPRMRHIRTVLLENLEPESGGCREFVFRQAAKYIAPKFAVSVHAMKI